MSQLFQEIINILGIQQQVGDFMLKPPPIESILNGTVDKGCTMWSSIDDPATAMRLTDALHEKLYSSDSPAHKLISQHLMDIECLFLDTVIPRLSVDTSQGETNISHNGYGLVFTLFGSRDVEDPYDALLEDSSPDQESIKLGRLTVYSDDSMVYTPLMVRDETPSYMTSKDSIELDEPSLGSGNVTIDERVEEGSQHGV